jgi:hypothetical protein
MFTAFASALVLAGSFLLVALWYAARLLTWLAGWAGIFTFWTCVAAFAFNFARAVPYELRRRAALRRLEARNQR